MGDIDFQSVEAILSKVSGFAKIAGEGVSIAAFAGFDRDGQFLIALSDASQPVSALSTIGLSDEDLGKKMVVAFEKDNLQRPIILGRVLERRQSIVPSFKVDDERIVLKADREIELRCGDASIVLTKAGKVLIRGNYVLSRSRGANKIKGAFVDIN